MLQVLANRTYRHLFLAQVIALVGTGLATVALGLLAYDLAGGHAGEVLGTALAIKMIAYIGIAPIAGAVANRLPRRTMLVMLDAVRAAVAVCLPFVDQVWQVYTLIFVVLHVLPSDPALMISEGSASKSQLESLRHQYGLDRPLWRQYADSLRSLVQGRSFSGGCF